MTEDDWFHLAYVDGNVRAAAYGARLGFELSARKPDPDSWPAPVWLRLRIAGTAAREDEP